MQSSGPQPQLAMPQGTKGTTGPLNSTSGDTTHDDSSGQVSFVCRPGLAFVGSGALCRPGFGSWENWFQSARYSHVRPCET